MRGAGEGEEGGRGNAEGPVGSTLWITCCGFVRVPWTPGFAAALGWTWLADGFSPFLCQTCRGVSPHVRPERGAVPFRDPSAPRSPRGEDGHSDSDPSVDIFDLTEDPGGSRNGRSF